MFNTLQYYTFLIILMMAAPLAQAQKGKKIKYDASRSPDGYSEFGRKNGEPFRLLVHDIQFTQEETEVFCDSTIFYPKRNIMQAYIDIKIVDDPAVITSDELIYEGNGRMARLRKNVIYIEGERRLYTDFLDYDLDAEIAHYFNGGKLIDSTNTLTSQIGYHFSRDQYAQFYTNVVLIAPDFTLKTDTLKYNTTTKVAYTYGPTEIIDNDGTTLFAQGGEFRTQQEETDFIDGQIETEDYYLKGDKLYFDEIERYYKAVQNVKMTAKDEDIIIIGDEGFYDRRKGISKIYGRPVMKRIMEADTFYLTADTLVAIESKYDSAKRILAYENIKIYQDNLQGTADSMAYFMSDSLLFFYYDPIMWNNQNQITADTISLEIKNETLDKMYLKSHSFLVSEDTIQNYNQIKGREMVTYFVDNEIDHIDVNGNGEIHYYALEEGDSILMGMNKIYCASMKIRFNENTLSSFSVYTKPEAQFIPPHELTNELKFLEGFSWREDERPDLFDVAYYLDPDYDGSSDSAQLVIPNAKPEKEKVLNRLAPEINRSVKGDGLRQVAPQQDFDRRRAIKRDGGI